MGSTAMQLGDKDLEAIGEYVKTQFPHWAEEYFAAHRPQLDVALIERIVRVEEGLKSLHENMDLRFEEMERRFEQVDKRFEQVDKRFEQVDKKFEQVDKRFEQVDKRFDQIDKRFEQVDKRFEDLLHYMDKRFAVLHWMIGLGFTVLATMMTVFAYL